MEEIEGATSPPFLVRADNGPNHGRKKLVRRDDREYSQPLRLGVQLFLVALNLWIGVQFFLWVRWAESGGRTLEVSRPAGVEGWLPIEGLMQLKYFLVAGQVPRVHAAGFFLFTSFLIISFVFRKVILQLAVSGGNCLRISVEAGPRHVPPEFSIAALGRHRAAFAEIHPAELLRLRGSQHVSRGHR